MNGARAAGRARLGLTPVQRKVLRVVEDFGCRRGYSPTIREIGEATGHASVSAVSHHVRALERKGYLSRVPGQPRTVVVLPVGGPAVAETDEAGAPAIPVPRESAIVPLWGRVAAGDGVLAPGQVEDWFCLPGQLVGEGAHFILKVTGDSMIGAAIADGDWVVVREQPDAENGDIVAAEIDGIEVEGTVKTLKRVDGHVWLLPHNPAYKPIPGDKAKIRGKVVAVLRRV